MGFIGFCWALAMLTYVQGLKKAKSYYSKSNTESIILFQSSKLDALDGVNYARSTMDLKMEVVAPRTM